MLQTAVVRAYSEHILLVRAPSTRARTQGTLINGTLHSSVLLLQIILGFIVRIAAVSYGCGVCMRQSRQGVRHQSVHAACTDNREYVQARTVTTHFFLIGSLSIPYPFLGFLSLP
jgi:hypothetical protein